MANRWVFGARWIPNIDVDRARLRTTLVYRFTPRVQAGVEYNPLADDVGPVGNWRVWDEQAARPALIVGTSSDRIGTDHGRAYYATLSKSLDNETGLPLSPYAGIAFGEFDDEWVGIAGLVIRWDENWRSYHLWDGYNFHNIVETTLGRHTLGLVLVQQEQDFYLGLSYSVGVF